MTILHIKPPNQNSYNHRHLRTILHILILVGVSLSVSGEMSLVTNSKALGLKLATLT